MELNKNSRLIQGTWLIEKDKMAFEALDYGIKRGLKVIDTAEMYGDGKSEELVGKVISKYKRDEIYLISKVYPYNSNKKRMRIELINSLNRLKIDYLDLYLLHWRGDIELSETVEAFEELKKEGLIKNWGVSNFDVSDMEELISVKNGENCYCNQVLYNIISRGIEFDLIPWMKEKNIKLMIYSPLGHNDIIREKVLTNKTIKELAKTKKNTVYQLMLTFVLRNKDLYVVTKSSSTHHIEANIECLDINLTDKEIKRIDKEFIPPKSKIILEEI
ncbi:aldo/keto reductase [Haploplasma axanthum]|uniref:General stress protein 69 n=1 Tax=Haploplasma axanthum TaxID=29552 RepID=A0A449BCK6_HAPAX|nr:aldo/keto reductase [Haploplasma axanthum]VEU80165.1 General stress protein 69 [Haploplasma axanthum]